MQKDTTNSNKKIAKHNTTINYGRRFHIPVDVSYFTKSHVTTASYPIQNI